MEDNNSGKLSSRSGKTNKVIPASLVDAKQKKPKKKKKGRRNSNKPDIEDVNKHTSDEDKGRLEVEGVGATENDPEGSSTATSQSGGATTKLPKITNVKAESPSDEAAGPPSSSPSLPHAAAASHSMKPASLVYRPEQTVVNSLAQKINSLNIKQRQNGAARGNPASRVRPNNAGKAAKLGRGGKDKGAQPGTKSAPAGVKVTSTNAFGTPGADSRLSKNSSGPTFSLSASAMESLRWENVLEDTEEERERIRLYKINRRKRYLAAAQAKGLGWALNQSFQISDDYGLDNRSWATSTAVVGPSSGSYQTTDFAPMRSLRASGAHGMMGAAMVEC